MDKKTPNITKYFTPEEAERTLPLVRKIVQDILDTGFQIKTIAESIGGEAYNNQEVLDLAGEMDKYIQELEEIGCYYKDWNFTIGLVDFPARINDREVYLCWRSDEDEIRFYHGIDEGYSGRKRIPDKYFAYRN